MRVPVLILWVTALVAAGCALHDPSRHVAAGTSCIYNLRQIDGAIQQAFLASKMPSTYKPTWEEIRPFLPGGKIPKCPQGGTYSLVTVVEAPRCSIGGPKHSLPP